MVSSVSHQNFPNRFILLLCVTGVSSVGSGMILPFTSIYFTLTLRLGAEVPAVYFGGVAAVSIFSAMIGGQITDRRGGRLAGAAGSGARCVAMLILSQCSNIWEVVLAAVVMGAGNGLCNPAMTPTVISLVPPDLRRHAFSMRYIVMNTGVIVGAIFGSVAVADATTPGAFRLIFIGNGISYLAVMAWFWRFGQRSLREDENKAHEAPANSAISSYRLLLKSRPLVLLLLLQVLVPFFGYTQLEITVPLIASRILHLPNLLVGNIIAINALSVFALRKIARSYSAKFPEEFLLIMTGVIWFFAYAVALPSGLTSSRVVQVTSIGLFCVIFAAGELIYSSAQSPLMARLCPPDMIGRATALGNISWNLGQIGGPLLSTMLVATNTPSVAWTALAGGAIGIIGVAGALSLTIKSTDRSPAGPVS